MAPAPPPIVPLPDQPAGVPWPTDRWPTGDPAELGADATRLRDLVDELFEPEVHPTLGRTYAAAVVAGGRLVVERYGRRAIADLHALAGEPTFEQVTAETELLSWSMAKSITSLAVGTAVADGVLAPDDPVGDPRWTAEPGDPRAAITWDDLLAMRPGLAWTEQYYDLVPGQLPDVVRMLFGSNAADMAAFAATKELVHAPGSTEAYCYSSGTTNIVAANLQRLLGLDQPGMERYLRDRIFDPIGLASARPQFDGSGTFIGSSYVHATLADWCRFGLLALRGGRWDGRDVVPPGWIDGARRGRSWDDPVFHAAHWWAWNLPEGPFGAQGFEGQRVICFPARDVVVVRLGQSGPDDGPALNAHVAALASCFPET
jgi:CubicO group peptidase (beta-lactamase class C family)